MCLNIFVLSFLAISPTLSAVVKEDVYSCSANEFACKDGACISYDRVCDGTSHCADGTDEAVCYGESSDLLPGSGDLHRAKRQSGCRRNQWKCRDGSCISFDGKCDGIVNCPDGSDETHPLCRKMICQDNWFRCTYGACVDGTAPCNGVQDCADNSDELLPRCRNSTGEYKRVFKCDSGEEIPSVNLCDGMADCRDGSDENVRACAGKTCPDYLFQCAYGACVDQGADCNGAQECADGSDESDELCNRISAGTTTTTLRPAKPGDCILPPYPDHGRYTAINNPNAAPGQSADIYTLNVTCDSGYGLNAGSSNLLYCFSGTWSGDMPQCVRFCKLVQNPGVEYRCDISSDSSITGSRPCQVYEPSGTVVKPSCKSPNYYSTEVLSRMRCIDGFWDYTATCIPECGRVTPEGEQLVIGGRTAKRGELPWHAGIYRKTTTPYQQICGGSLIRTTVVISAAHCFWDDAVKLQAANKYAVAVGKIYRPWNEKHDTGAQFSDVSEIRVPDRFAGIDANYQDDLALVIVSKAFEYKTYVRPVCLDFDIKFNRRQLQPGNLGKVAGWGLTAVNGKESPILRVVEIPYVNVLECVADSPPGFREYITSDKFCAGFRNGTALCKGDSGGGLAFPELDRGENRFYLRGLVSTAPNNEDLCNAFALTTFTQLTSHEEFILSYIPTY